MGEAPCCRERSALLEGMFAHIVPTVFGAKTRRTKKSYKFPPNTRFLYEFSGF